MRKFNPNRYVRVARKDLDRAIFWYEFRLGLKVFLIVGSMVALAIWGLLAFFDRM